MNLLQETIKPRCKGATTPIEPEKRGEEESPPTNKDRYQSLVGKLILHSHIGLEIGFAMSMDTHYTSNPTEAHMKTTNKILQTSNVHQVKGSTLRRTQLEALMSIPTQNGQNAPLIKNQLYNIALLCGETRCLEKQETVYGGKEWCKIVPPTIKLHINV